MQFGQFFQKLEMRASSSEVWLASLGILVLAFAHASAKLFRDVAMLPLMAPVSQIGTARTSKTALDRLSWIESRPQDSAYALFSDQAPKRLRCDLACDGQCFVCLRLGIMERAMCGVAPRFLRPLDLAAHI